MSEEAANLEYKLNQVLRQLVKISEQNADLQSENLILKAKLRKFELSENRHNSFPAAPRFSQQVSKPIIIKEGASFSKSDKIALFRKLFRGREDVYPLRWESSRNGKSGYSPAIKNKWEYHEAKKQGDKNVNPEYLPVTDEIIQQHLEGKIVAGVYPLLLDDTCWFLAVDFDEKEYEVDASSFIATCESLSINAYLERSRSCNGAHVWIFFEEPLSAALARQLGFTILTKTIEIRHQLSLSSYDRFFPNQDTMPRGGFGNLIALPLQLKSRDKGGSIFLTTELTPVEDQWGFLSSVKRVSIDTVKKIVLEAQKTRSIINVAIPSYDDSEEEDPWILPPSKKKLLKPVIGPFPENIKVIRSNLIFIGKESLSPSFLNRLRLLGAFQNPEFFKNQAMRLPVYDKPRVIDCSEDTGKYIALPRGCIDDVLDLMKQYSIKVEIEDLRYQGLALDVEFVGSLRVDQESTIQKLLSQDIGLLSAPTAFGKTVLSAAMIARRGVNSLILVHRQQLIDQWKERLQSFLSISKKSIGQIGAGKKKPTGVIDIAMIQSLVRQGEVSDIVANYGQVIIDECHHVSAFSFEQVLKGCKAKYVLGLTATPKRKDGHHPIIIMQCGQIVRADNASAASDGAQKQTRSVIIRETNFTVTPENQSPSMNDLYQALANNRERSEMIAADIIEAVRNGHCPLVLTERIEHLEKLEALLNNCACPKIILKGGIGKKQRQEAMKQLQKCPGSRIILATGRYIGEGFDDPKLDMLFLALPISWTGTLQQYVGRLHRVHDGKNKVIVYDYVDSQVPTLQRMLKKRLRGYRALGYEVISCFKKYTEEFSLI